MTNLSFLVKLTKLYVDSSQIYILPRALDYPHIGDCVSIILFSPEEYLNLKSDLYINRKKIENI